jgi:vacuolar-type H+-ATPase subunit D/Vma8
MENKITKEQLDKITDQQKVLNMMLSNIGVLESQKHALLHQIAEVNKEIEETKAGLENEYGAININLEDGSYTEIEKKDE